MKKVDFDYMKKVAEGEDSPERTALANALLIVKIQRNPLSFNKCMAIFDLIYGD